MGAPRKTIAAVIAEHAPRLIKVPGVAAVAEGRTADGRTCLLILVVALTENLRDLLPVTLEGFPVEIQVSGEIRPLRGE
jgi:hypothetical protein